MQAIRYTQEQIDYLFGLQCMHMVELFLVFPDARAHLPLACSLSERYERAVLVCDLLLIDDSIALYCQTENLLPVTSSTWECFVTEQDVVLLLARALAHCDSKLFVLLWSTLYGIA